MLLYALAMLSGDIMLQSRAILPNMSVVLALIFIVVIFCWINKRTRYVSMVVLCCLLGFMLSAWRASSVLSLTLPKDKENVPLMVTGHIDSLPVSDHFGARFYFKLDNHHALVHLAWHHPALPLHVGDKWQLQVKLKRIHGLQNTGGFDYEAWALQKGLRASGVVLQSAMNKRLEDQDGWYLLDRVREYIQSQISPLLPRTATAPWLLALITGERSGIEQSGWQVLKNTGTNHLMAIAGLHIGILSGFFYTLVFFAWSRLPRMMQLIPAQHAASCAALVVAIFYSALSGFSIPTQRACIMLAVFIVALLIRRQVSAWQTWSLALIMVLFINPLSVLTESFWLSFCTLALIVYGMSARLRPVGFWWKHFRVQWVIGVGLVPFALLFFQQTSLVSFFANMIAIPWLGILILPFCFLASITVSIFPLIATIALLLADNHLTYLWHILSWFSALPVSVWIHPITSTYLLVTTVIAFLFFLLPIGMPMRWLGIIWLLPLMLQQQPRPAKNDYWVTLLDVGQGLSVVVQTYQHLLVFDAGPRTSEQSDAGAMVVLPYLYTLGRDKIDRLVVSHGDNDHIGGVQALLAALPVLSVMTSTPEKIPGKRATYCLAGYAWQWDGVRFEFLYPTPQHLFSGNDSSCVLRIDNGTKRTLLTGDIEKMAEWNLLATASDKLQADIVIAPHHGSNTSGMKAFIEAVHPVYVLYATGYLNRYRFPHQEVMLTYDAVGAIPLDTAKTGAIKFKLKKATALQPPDLYRQDRRHYWYS